MDSWIVTAREAVKRSSTVRMELRAEAQLMWGNGELDAARRTFEDVLDEPVPETKVSVPDSRTANS